MIKVVGVDHVVFPVEDPERSVAWYRDKLGLEPVRLEEWRRGEVPFVSVRMSATTIIDLVQGERTGENVHHVALVLDGSVDLEEVAASGDFDVVQGPSDLFGAQGIGRGLYVKDLDGNLIELRTYSG